MNSVSYGKPFDVAVRLLLATVGGYFISLWTAIVLTPLLPGDKHTQVLTAIELVFLIYLIVFIWSFARTSLKKLTAEALGVFFLTGSCVLTIHGSLS